MTIQLSLQHRTDFTISAERWQRVQSAELDKVEYGNQAAVQKARAAIVHMGIWDTFVDNVFNFGSKQRALNAIATIILGAKANALGENQPVAELSPDAVHDAKYELVTHLSRDGALNFASIWRDTGEGIEFSPKTGDGEFDRLLATSVFPYGLAAVVWEKANMHGHASQAWDKSSSAWGMEEGGLGYATEAKNNASSQKALHQRSGLFSERMTQASQHFGKGQEYLSQGHYRLANAEFEMAQEGWKEQKFPLLEQAADFASMGAAWLAAFQANRAHR